MFGGRQVIVVSFDSGSARNSWVQANSRSREAISAKQYVHPIGSKSVVSIRAAAVGGPDVAASMTNRVALPLELEHDNDDSFPTRY